MGAGAAPPPEAGAGAPPCSADAAWGTLGIWIVCPATTSAVAGRPFAAASDRVVKLLAAAIDQRVSPGWTVCATYAPAEAGASRATSAAMAAPSVERRNGYPSRWIEGGFAVTQGRPCRARAAMSTCTFPCARLQGLPQEVQELLLTGRVGRHCESRMGHHGLDHLRQLALFDAEHRKPRMAGAGRQLCHGFVAERAVKRRHRLRSTRLHQASGVRQHHRVRLRVRRAAETDEGLA